MLPRLFRLAVSKLITWIPLALLLAVAWNDHRTGYLLQYLGPDAITRFHHNLYFEVPAILGVAYLSTIITIRLFEMDGIWNDYWKKIKSRPAAGRRA
jgi:uncharacterized membrane protein